MTAPQHRLRCAGRTHPGLIRNNNEDAFVTGSRALVVADGMGGHAAGEVASRLVVDAFAPLNAGPGPADLLGALERAVQAGNTAIAHLVAERPALDGMGTTVTAMLFDGPHMGLAHVGDSRAYLYRSDVLHQLTHDDTFVQSLVDEGRITEQQAHAHPQRNLVLRALTGIEVEPMLVAREVQRGDRFLLCSDGLCGVVGAESIAEALAHPDPDAAADTLIRLALAAGGPDNVTVIVADVIDTGVPATGLTESQARQVQGDDPESTSPIQQLTREMPRVPLPPIPEEPAAAAEIIDDDVDDMDEAADAEEAAETAPEVADADSSATAEMERDPAGGPSEASTAGDIDGAANSAAAASAAAEAPAAGDRRPQRAPRSRGSRRTRADTPRRRWYRRGAILVAALVLLATAIAGSTIWVRNQYYVSDQGNLVVVFRGVDGSLLGWVFSTFEETSCGENTNCSPMKVSDLQPAAQNQVRAGIKAASLADARTVVLRLSAQLLPPCPVTGPPPTSPPPTGPPPTGPPDGFTESRTAAPTPLAPATEVPGVTCRSMP